MNRQADYMLALKDNHPTLHEDVVSWLDYCDACGDVHQVESIEKKHGRLETRRVVVSTELDWLKAKPEWAVCKMRTGSNHDYRRQILFGQLAPEST